VIVASFFALAVASYVLALFALAEPEAITA
jgi:hypothetical protein